MRPAAIPAALASVRMSPGRGRICCTRKRSAHSKPLGEAEHWQCPARIVLMLRLGILALGCAPLIASAAPNILFVMSDDHAAPALSAYGGDLISTPNLDRLAAEGARFDAAFVTNSICTPQQGGRADRQAQPQERSADTDGHLRWQATDAAEAASDGRILHRNDR